jgi:predicted DNA-binding transcriptional regulator YafY
VNHNNAEEKVRINRILKIDDAIRAKTYPNAVALAKRMGVTNRTILRDIEYLRDMYKAPIEYDYNKRGFYYTEENFFIKSIILTEGELFSVALFDKMLEQYRGTPLEKQLRAIFDKILKSLPENVTLESVFSPSQATCIPDAPVPIDPEVFEKIFIALKKRVTFTGEYRSLSRRNYVAHALDPYHAVYHRGYWYVIAYSHDNREIRTYLFSRFRKVAVSRRKFVFPADFDTSRYFDKQMGVYNTGGKTYTFEFILDKEIGTYAVERFYHDTQTVEQRSDGSVYVKFTTSQIAEVLRWTLSQGDWITVLGPPEFVETVKGKIKKMGQKYFKP